MPGTTTPGKHQIKIMNYGNYDIKRRTEQLETHYRHTKHRSPGHTPPNYLRIDNPPEICTPQYGHNRCLYSGKLYPNGEFGIGKVPPPRARKADTEYDEGIVGDCQVFSEARTHVLEDGTYLRDIGDMYDQAGAKLGSACELSHKPKKYGLLGITGYGRKIVRNLAYLLQKEEKRFNLQMGTLTIPSLPEEYMLAIAINWGYITSRFFQECRRRYNRMGLPFRYVSVTEIQPQRWQKYRQVGLHIHFLFRPYKSSVTGEWSMDDNWVRATWKRILLNVLPPVDDIETPNYRREQVHSSAAAYMGKYMSKGGSIVSEVLKEKGEDYIPSQWWSADQWSKKNLKRQIVHLHHDRAKTVLKLCETRAKGVFHYCSPIEVETPANGTRVYGYHGRFTDYGRILIDFIPISEILYG